MGKSRSSKKVCIVFVLCVATAIASRAQTLTTLANFNGINGASPNAPLVQGSDGNFYGITIGGGDSDNCNFIRSTGCGTVFKMTSGGTLTTLHSFAYTDGFFLYSGQGALVQGSDGNFYGTTDSGGTGENCGLGCGTVFKITRGGVLTALHNFAGYPSDGATPLGGLAQGDDGSFYGTTLSGGTNSNCGSFGCGTVFRITSGGVLTVLHNFDGTDGEEPQAGLVQANDGKFYGTTLTGGAYGGGTVFKITSDGVLTTLQSLEGNPGAGLVEGTDGNFYGTTLNGLGNGMVFTITPGGTLTTLHVFTGYPTDGAAPEAALVQGTDGNFYGTTSSGGASDNCTSAGENGCGTLFKITAGGTLTILHNFDSTDGISPNGLVQGTDGNFYGTTGGGGANGDGTVFRLSVGLVLSPVQFVPVTPCRLVDTRPQYGGGGPIQGGTSQVFILPQLAQTKGCADLSSAAAYSLNVTVVPSGPLGYLTLWPPGKNRPGVSTLNSLDGRIKANAAIVPVGASRAVSVYVTNTTNVILDIDGYFAPVSASTLAFYPLPPCRVADTRYPNGHGLGSPYLTAGRERDFPILNATACNIPSDAAAYSLNFTVVPHGALYYMTVWPTGQSLPNVSTLNDIPGEVIANAAIVPAGDSGKVSVQPSNDTDLVIDINGYFAMAGRGGLSLYPAAPCRVLDTRGVGRGLPFSGTLSPPVDVVNGACGTPATAQAYVFNATVVPQGALGYLTLWPDGELKPNASTLNALDGSISSNMAIVPTNNGKVDAYASGITQLILDISSYFAP